jgi:copper oxidase (laccase) domain-containing protein
MFSLEKKKTIEYLQSDLLRNCDFLEHAFCTRRGGASQDEYKSLNMSFREGDEEFRVLSNWDRLATAFAIPMEQFLVVNQVHGDAIFVIKQHGSFFSTRDELNYDAIVTSRANLAICIKTADCAGISAKVIKVMQSQYRCHSADILAAIGPSIGCCCYEVDQATADAFRQQNNYELFLQQGKKKDKWMLDLVEANRSQILEAGIPESNIEVSGFCTTCNQDMFFSHRGSGGITGRQINFMMIKGDPPCRVLTIDSESSWIQ